MKIEELFKKYLAWFMKESDSIEQLRLKNDEKGRKWCYKPLEYDKDLTLEEYQTFFDRKKQNDEYAERFKEDDIPAKKAFAFYQTEINLIYSFHKCFAMRNMSRLQYYRNDLSQKGVRVPSAVRNAMGKYKLMRESAETKE